MRARGGESYGGGKGRGAGMMQCLATGVCARTRRGLQGWWEVGERREAGCQLQAPNIPNGYQPWPPVGCRVDPQ